jgi:hypothetical protein
MSTCAQPQGRPSQQISISLRLTGESSGHTLTSAQPLGSRPPVLIHSDVLLNRSLSHCVSQENHLEYHIISTLYTEENSKPITWAPSPLTGVHIVSSPSQRERHTQLMGFLTPHRGTQRSISVSERNDTPISWAHPTHGLPHPTQGHTTFHLRLREEQHTHLMGTPNSWASSPCIKVEINV